MSFLCCPGRALRVLLLSTSFFAPSLASIADAAEVSLNSTKDDPDLTQRLQDASSIVSADLSGQDSVQELLAAALSDYRTLVQVLYDAGHFSPVVRIRLDGREAASIRPLYPPRSISTIAITVEPGPRFTFGKTRVTPLPRESDVELPRSFTTGQPASTSAIRDARQEGIRAWRRVGHAKAKPGGQSITANHLQARLDAELRLNPGPQLRFGELFITGQTAVRTDAIRRIAGFPSGEVTHPDVVNTVGGRLRRTGSWSSVTLREAEVANPDGSLDYTAEFEDLPRRRLTFGAELSSSNGAEVSGSWMHRNLFGGAEKLRFEMRLSGIGGNNDLDGRIAVRLDRPATLGPDDSTLYLAEFERLDEEHYRATRGLVAFGARREISKSTYAEATVAFDNILAEDAYGKRRFKYIEGQLKVERDKRDSRISATSGYFLNAELRPFFGLSGTDSGLRLNLDWRSYFRLGQSDRLVFAGRLQMGSVIGPSANDVSPTLLFFSGGAGSVRGQEYQSLGVPVGTNTAGGRGYMALSAEVRARVTEKISVVGFYDLGLIDTDSFITSHAQKHAGAGLGFRYDVAGIGPIRLDLAYPIDGGSIDGLQFYIGIGQAF